jgi:hypothetical protein
MRRLAGLLLLFAPGCSDLPEDYPVAPGGWAPGGNNGRDSGVDDSGDGGAMIAGRVCVVGDLRDLETCAVADAGGLTVSLGTRTATTAEDGAFTILAPAGSNLVWRVTGPTLITTVMPFGAVTKIPAVTDATFGAVLAGSGVVLSVGQGSLVARVVQAGQPVTGAIAVAAPDPQYDPYYDGDSATAWDQDSTGPAGLVWLTGVPVGMSMVTAMRAGGGNVAATHLVEDQAITFATLEIP